MSKTDFRVGDRVKLLSGMFCGNTAIITEIDDEHITAEFEETLTLSHFVDGDIKYYLKQETEFKNVMATRERFKQITEKI